MTTTPALYHGGIPGLHVGDKILPPSITGTSHNVSNELTQLGRPDLIRPDMVYATTVQDLARGFAAMYPDGTIYQVEMTGTTQPDPDLPITCVMAPSARIVAVVRERVYIAHRRLDSWLRLMDDSLTRAGELSGRRNAGVAPTSWCVCNIIRVGNNHTEGHTPCTQTSRITSGRLTSHWTTGSPTTKPPTRSTGGTETCETSRSSTRPT